MVFAAKGFDSLRGKNFFDGAIKKAVPHGTAMERMMGIEPTSQAWEARVLPMNYTRMDTYALSIADSHG